MGNQPGNKKWNKITKPIFLAYYSLGQINNGIKGVFIIAIVGVLNYETGFFRLFIVNRLTVAINVILIQIAYAFITGVVFYYAIEMYQQSKKRIAISGIIINAFYVIQFKTLSIFNEIARAEGIRHGEEIDLERFQSICNKFRIHQAIEKPWFYGPKTFRDFILHNCDEISRAAYDIVKFSDLFDDKWIKCATIIISETRSIRDLIDHDGTNSTLFHAGLSLWGLYSEQKILQGYVLQYYNASVITNANSQNRIIPDLIHIVDELE